MLKEETALQEAENKTAESRSLAVGVTSFFLILLQSACTAFVAISGLRLLIGIGSLAAATTGFNFLRGLHGTAFRLPMEGFGIAGSFANLYGVWRARSLRARPSAQWRVKPMTAKQKRSEAWQIALAVVTFLLVAVEWSIHILHHGSI